MSRRRRTWVVVLMSALTCGVVLIGWAGDEPIGGQAAAPAETSAAESQPPKSPQTESQSPESAPRAEATAQPGSADQPILPAPNAAAPNASAVVEPGRGDRKTVQAVEDDAKPTEPPAEGEAEAAPPPELGVVGLLPEEIPLGLAEDALSALGKNWEKWNEEFIETFSKLYSIDEPLTLAQQRAVIDQLETKRQVMITALRDPKYVMIRDPLVSLSGRLHRRLELNRALLKTLSVEPGRQFEMLTSATASNVETALRAFESHVNAYAGGGAWLDYVEANALRKALVNPMTGVAAGRASLAKLKDTGKLSPEAKQFASSPAFRSLEFALDRYVAEGVRANLPYRKNLRSHLAKLVEAIEQHEERNLVGDATDLKAALNLVRLYAIDGAPALESIVRVNYLNYNFQALISENLMAKFVSDSKTEFKPVRDFGLGAHIRGWSNTTTHASFDLKPSDDGGRFEIKVSGQSHSDTVGITEKATVRSIGNHSFYAAKTGTFDGEYFHTQSAAVSVNPSTQPVALTTKYDWIPLFGRIARNMAWDQVRAKQPQSRAFAAMRIRQRVGPEMDAQLDKNFADATRELQTDLFVRLKNAGLYSQTNKLLSTEEMLRVSSRVGLDQEPAGAAPEDAFPPGNGITASIHESLLNNGANRLKFHGRTMTEAEVRKEIGAYFSQLTKKTVDLMKDYDPKKSEGPSTFVFDAKDPVRFQIEDGQIVLVIRAGFKEKDKDDIPPQIVTVPLVPRLEGADIVVERGQVKVAPVSKPENVALQIARAGIIRKKLESSFPTKKQTRKIEMTRENKPTIVLWVMRMKAVNGWLTVWAE